MTVRMRLRSVQRVRPTMHTPSNPRDRLTEIGRAGLVALLVAGAAYAVSCLLVPLHREPLGFGVQWQMMSSSPFELLGQFPHRLLAPVLAYVLGLGGPGYLAFVRGLTVLMLAVVFLYCRQKQSRVIDAALITLAVALTGPVQTYKLNWVGYSDPLCYTLFFLMAMNARHTAVFWSLLLLNLFNHELAIFLVPWAWFLRQRAGAPWRRDLVWLGSVVAIYAVFYLAVRAIAKPLFSIDYFVAIPLFPAGTLGVCVLAMTHCTFAYGPLLAVLAWHQRVAAYGRERLEPWLVLAGIAAIFCIAYDWSRHSNLIVLPFVLASVRFLAAGHRAVFAGLLAASTLLSWAIDPWPITWWPLTERVLQPLFDSHVVRVYEDHYEFGTLSDFFFGWLPLVWPTLLSIAGMLAAIFAAGVAFAGWRQRDHGVAPAVDAG